MAQKKKLGGGRKGGMKVGRREKMWGKRLGRREKVWGNCLGRRKKLAQKVRRR